MAEVLTIENHTVYKTTDGKGFADKSEALKHQSWLNLTKQVETYAETYKFSSDLVLRFLRRLDESNATGFLQDWLAEGKLNSDNEGD